ncbi:hypothetical protein L0657_06895 [Dyadobacter sp. CY345]|uniref:ligand-binding sensor domain-containing protein n=1 Tax=Dyadobacter sp. CY345 TaxID=2909335 RepID=UPI001F2D6B75|nr:two-component regulator propeller domain-containing protein [Dyadobacter sp. CY345]MCF2443676.1 hypothetical protein [Dyadobacter sp. CY345]
MKRQLALLSMIFVTASCSVENTEITTPQEHEVEWIIYNKENSKLPDNQVNALAIDDQDNKWIGTAKGLVRIKNETWTIFTHANSSLPSDHVTALTLENDGTVWVGTDDGLARFDGNNWSVYTNENSVLTNNNIKCLAHDTKVNVTWIGTDEGLVKADKNLSLEHISVADNTILSVTTDHYGALWVGFFKSFAFIGQISKYENGVWQHHNLHNLGYPSSFPYGLAIDKNNAVLAVLAGTSTRAVIRNNESNWEEITRPDGARGLKTILLEDEKIWVGGNSLAIFGSKNAECVQIPGQETLIQAMALDSKGRKWLGTMAGGLAGYKPIK